MESIAEATFQLKPGMRIAPDSLQANLVTARSLVEMECNAYETTWDSGGGTTSKLIASQKSQPFTTGMPSTEHIQMTLPAPHNHITIVFTNAMAAYGETGWNNYKPYVQMFFRTNKEQKPVTNDVRDLSFDITSSARGSKLLLRSYTKITDVQLIAGQCSLHFL